jgi:hypothetical protein
MGIATESIGQPNAEVRSMSLAGNGPGNLAVVSVANNQLDYFYRDDK